MKITLAILAAGLGSRFGADKQIEPIHQHAILLDYSIYDALRAGFDEVVLIIRSEIEAMMRAHFKDRFPKAKISFVFQDRLTPKYLERKKPWGTGHALLCLKDSVKNPFLIINADDFYGKGAFSMMAEALRKKEEGVFYSAGYKLGNSLSENGTVSRGICSTDDKNNLIEIQEHTKLRKSNPHEAIDEATGNLFPLSTFVSMNFWGFTPDIFQIGIPLFETFIKENKENPTAEFYIPTLVSEAKHQGYVIRILPTDEVWFGMTYRDDLPLVKKEIETLTEKGIYPNEV
jgi:dTDP-glucose pyrophosphorylase